MASEVPQVERTPVPLPATGPEGEMWQALLEVSERIPVGWTLIGGLMVVLHGRENRVAIERTTRDLDVVVHGFSITDLSPADFSQTLEDLDWELDPADFKAEGVGYRFTRGQLKFDVLAPEGRGERFDLTTRPPAETVAIDGGTQALRRTELVPVTCGGTRGMIPRPDLLGAVVAKSCAVVGDTRHRQEDGKAPERHSEDLAWLYAMMKDPSSYLDGGPTPLSRKDRARIRAAGDPSWEVVVDPELRQAGQSAREILLRR